MCQQKYSLYSATPPMLLPANAILLNKGSAADPLLSKAIRGEYETLATLSYEYDKTYFLILLFHQNGEHSGRLAVLA